MTSWLSNYRLLVVLITVLSLSGCGKTVIDLGNNQVGLRLPDGYLIKAEVADTEAERAQGLSNRASLSADDGMWFIFDQDGRYPCWMPDMNFAIDIIWVGSDFRIVEIASDVQPEPGVPLAQLEQYINQSPARYVLELTAGVASAHKLEVGSKIELISS
ncbi:DUF192 domain-containing protein [Patescibacteria group bacterium]|nr:DUF192 domain-containing protein [Patescibacteria group bacterium]